MATDIEFYKVEKGFDTSDLPFLGCSQLEEVYGTRKPYISYEMMDFVELSPFGYGDAEVAPLLKFVEREQEATMETREKQESIKRSTGVSELC